MLILAAVTFMNWLHRLGGPGLILLALADNSFIPLPGSMDALTVILSASKRDLWWYYALMATVGSVIAGYLMYRLGSKGGRETIEKRFGKHRAEKAYTVFERYGFWSVFVGALAPPPMPIVPFLLSAGAMQYPRNKFLAALTLSRGIRYSLLAYLASMYGRHILGWMHRYYKPLLAGVVVAGIMAGLGALYLWRKHRKATKSPAQGQADGTKATA